MTGESGGSRPFHQELAELRSLLLEMSGLAERQVEKAVGAMLSGDLALAHEVVANDPAIDDLELRLDKASHEILALHQPLASDLRFVTMAMKISNDLERVGDHAESIARTVPHMAGLPYFRQMPEVVEMARLASGMLSEALDAFMRSDPQQARRVCDSDDQVDRLYNSLFRILLTHMMEDPRRIGSAMSILLISKNLERIADLATNIAEDVVFLVEGIVIKHHPSGAEA
jgi:phosphate transport system protein